MQDTLKDVLQNQYQASLAALNLPIHHCPPDLWNAPVANWKFCQAAFHVVFFTDLYLQPSDDVQAFKSQPFHQAHQNTFKDYEEFADHPQIQLYEKSFVQLYLQHTRQKAEATLQSEAATLLTAPSGFKRRPCTRAELHVYNIRHIQHHAAQLTLILRQKTNIEIPWVGHTWKDPNNTA